MRKIGSQGQILGLKSSAVFEMLLLLVALLLLDSYAFSADRFSTLSVNPFLVLIVLISVQYGIKEGLCSLFLCTFASLYNNLPLYSANEDLFSYWTQVSKKPLLWFACASVLGSIAQRHRNRAQEALSALHAANDRAHYIALEFKKLESEKLELAESLAAYSTSPAQIFSALKSFELKDTKKILLSVQQLVASALGPAKMSVYAMEAKGLELVSSFGWSKADEFLTTFARDSAVFKMLRKSKNGLCCADPFQAEVLNRQGLLMVPIINPTTEGDFYGAIKIEDFDFIKLHTGTRDALISIAQFVGNVYSNALYLRMLLSEFEAEEQPLENALARLVKVPNVSARIATKGLAVEVLEHEA